MLQTPSGAKCFKALGKLRNAFDANPDPRGLREGDLGRFGARAYAPLATEGHCDSDLLAYGQILHNGHGIGTENQQHLAAPLQKLRLLLTPAWLR